MQRVREERDAAPQIADFDAGPESAASPNVFAKSSLPNSSWRWLLVSRCPAAIDHAATDSVTATARAQPLSLAT